MQYGAAALFLAASLNAGHANPSLLVEPSTGLVFYAEEADVPWRPASLTKLMTAYLTFEALRDGKLSPEDVLVCSQRAQAEPPSKLGLAVGGTLKVDLGLKALIVKSANDVAIMLAEKVGGTEANFVEMMNRTAQRLGMSQTHFVNPNGLPMLNADGTEAADQSITTARDMALLARMILQEFPRYAPLFAMPEFKIGGRLVTTHNTLLKAYDGADGMKTGFICASGYNIVASATRNGKQLLAVVLGETSGNARAVRAAAMFEHGFQIYEWKAVLAPTLATFPVAAMDGVNPPDMRGTVCNVKRVVKVAGHKRPPLAPGHRKPNAAKKAKAAG